MVPGSPRSGLRAESCEGPQPGGGLPAGSQPGIATAEDDRATNLISDETLGLGDDRPAFPIGQDVPSDAMSFISERQSKRKIRETLSDSDVEDRITRGRKTLRSRIIGSDSEDEPIVLSDSSEGVSAKVRRKRVNKPSIRNREVNLDGSIDLLITDFTACPVRLTCEDLDAKDADDISGVAHGWLADMELIRTKSKNLNGRLSGYWRDRIVCLRTVIKSLVDRVKDSGDLSYLRRRNDELAAQLRESKKEESRLQSFLKESDAKNEKLNSEIFALRRQPTGPVPAVKERQDTSRRTSRKELSVKKDAREGLSSVVESLQDCDDRLRAISKCDEKIAKFEELLKQMRTYLYGSIEAIAEKVIKTAEVVDPPKRGVPRITSDIQLVPPRPIAYREPESNPQHDDPVFSLTLKHGQR